MPRRPIRPTLFRCSLSLCAAISSHAVAQPEGRERVDPGVEDLGPQQISLRSFEVDLRSPLGFDLIYEGMRHDPYAGPFAPGERYLTRSSGAVTAVFPRSSYVPTRNGAVPTIPAGTIFYIGDPAETLRGPGEPARATGRQVHPMQRAPVQPVPTQIPTQIEGAQRDLRRDLSVPTEEAVESGEESEASDPPARRVMSIWGNETYREERVKRLIEAAAEIETARADAD